jgi:tight adherence protein C
MISIVLPLIIGVAIVMLVWSAYRIVADIPSEDRQYLDRPPLGFRLTWPLIRLLVHNLGPLLSQNYRLNVQKKLRTAGQDYVIGPEQYFAACCISSVVIVAIVAAIMVIMDIWSWQGLATFGFLGFFYPSLWLKEHTQARQKDILRALPFYLDIITLSVEAGTNLGGAFNQAVEKGPDGPLKSEFNRMLRELRAGKSRADALRSLSDRVNMSSVTSLVSSLIQAEQMGTSLGPVLRINADQRRIERFQRAEKLAMEAPVKLLGPLVMFIFPTTFIVLFFILMVKAVQEGVVTWAPLVHALSWPG